MSEEPLSQFPEIKRNPDGTFAKGSIPNPTGENGVKKGYQRYSTRLTYYETRYTRGELRAMSGDEKFLDTLSTLDVAAIKELAGLSSDSNPKWRRKDKNDCVERLDGKATQPVEHSGGLEFKTTIIL